MATDSAQIGKQKGIKYFLISFVDLFGSLRAKLVPTRAIKDMQHDGAGFAGFVVWLDMTSAHPDMVARPDSDGLIQLPWGKELAWVASDLWMNASTNIGSVICIKHNISLRHGEEIILNDDRIHCSNI